MESSGDLIGVIVELAACVQFGHDHLEGGNLELRMQIDGDSATVVAHGDAVVDVQYHFDLVAESGHRLIYGIVHDLIDEMVQSPGVGAAYVHGRAHAHSLKPFEHRYLIRIIIAAGAFARLEFFLRHRSYLFCVT